MIKKFIYLIFAVVGNALGTALMSNTDLGLSAWGSAAKNFSNFFNISFGTGFIILAMLFYLIAVIIRKKVILIEALLSFLFLISFGLLSDLFIHWIPLMTELNIILKVLINFAGVFILLLSIALHLKIFIAVHPCDVFLYQMQKAFKHDAIGTYITYFVAFSVALIFGLLYGEIKGIGIGTILTLTLSGALIRFFNQTILKKLTFKSSKSNIE
jgi:uncharacterized membrane protein YczE